MFCFLFFWLFLSSSKIKYTLAKKKKKHRNRQVRPKVMWTVPSKEKKKRQTNEKNDQKWYNKVIIKKGERRREKQKQGNNKEIYSFLSNLCFFLHTSHSLYEKNKQQQISKKIMINFFMCFSPKHFTYPLPFPLPTKKKKNATDVSIVFNTTVLKSLYWRLNPEKKKFNSDWYVFSHYFASPPLPLKKVEEQTKRGTRSLQERGRRKRVGRSEKQYELMKIVEVSLNWLHKAVPWQNKKEIFFRRRCYTKKKKKIVSYLLTVLITYFSTTNLQC